MAFVKFRHYIHNTSIIRIRKNCKVRYFSSVKEALAGIDIDGKAKYIDFKAGETWDSFDIAPEIVDIMERSPVPNFWPKVLPKRFQVARITPAGKLVAAIYDNSTMELIPYFVNTQKGKEDVEKQQVAQAKLNATVKASAAAFNTLSNYAKQKLSTEQRKVLVESIFLYNQKVKELQAIEGVNVAVKEFTADKAAVKTAASVKKSKKAAPKKKKKISGVDDAVGIAPIVIILIVAAVVAGGAAIVIDRYLERNAKIVKIKLDFDAIAKALEFKKQVAIDEKAGIITSEQAKELRVDVNKEIEVAEKSIEDNSKPEPGAFSGLQKTLVGVGVGLLVLKLAKVF